MKTEKRIIEQNMIQKRQIKTLHVIITNEISKLLISSANTKTLRNEKIRFNRHDLHFNNNDLCHRKMKLI